MHRFQATIILLVLFSWSVTVGVAVPTYDGHFSIGSLIPGLSSIQAVRSGHSRKGGARFMTVRPPNDVGNLSISFTTPTIPLFYIHHNRLWRYVNDTSIYAVNLVNDTQIPDMEHTPLQLTLDQKPGGIERGTWKWKGTMLIYEFGGRNNSGVYYDCRLPDIGFVLLTFLQGVPTPPGCTLITLHGFEHDV
jgi:hypothetical protein